MERILSLVGWREAATGLVALVTTAVLLSAGMVVANQIAGEDEPKREPVVNTGPNEQAPGSFVQRGTTGFQADELPKTFGSFRVLPAGSALHREMSYGDQRDEWTYRLAEAGSLAELPADELVRVPVLPDGYELQEIVYTIGESPDGSRQEISELHLTYSDGVHVDVSVSVARPTELSRGLPYPVVASEANNPLVVDVGEVAGAPAIFQFMKPDFEGEGLEEVIVADGEFLVVVSSLRGIDFDILVDAAASLTTR